MPRYCSRCLLLLFVILATLVACQSYRYHGTLLEPPKPLPDLVFQNVDGQFRLSEAGDGVMLLYFGYTHCPDVCPTTLYELRKAVRALGAEAERVQVGFVTVDPERDTPEQIATYLQNIDPGFMGLWAADDSQLAEIAAEFGVFYQAEEPEDSAAGYLVMHTSAVFVVQNLNLRLVIPYGTPGEDIAADVRRLLRDPSPRTDGP